MRKLLQQNSFHLISIEHGSSDDRCFYQDILNIRNEPYGHEDNSKLKYSFDKYSDHYRLNVDRIAVGGLSVTQATNGKMDCEEYIPQYLLERFRDVISSACKFRIIKQKITHIEKRSQFNLPKQLIKTAFKDQLSKGTRLDIINAHVSFARYYRQMGYLEVENSEFIHPELGTNSVVMFLPADPSHKSIVQSSIKEYDDHLLVSDIQRVLTRTSLYYQNTAA